MNPHQDTTHQLILGATIVTIGAALVFLGLYIFTRVPALV